MKYIYLEFGQDIDGSDQSVVQVGDTAANISDVAQSNNALVVFSLIQSNSNKLWPLVRHDHSRILHSPDGLLVDESSLGYGGDQIVELLPVLLQCILSLDSRTTHLTQ